MGMLLTPQLKEYADFLDKLAEAAAQITLSMFKKPLNAINKGKKLQLDFDPVTKADQQTESVIRTLINQTYPSHNILGEEHGKEHNHKNDTDTSWTWVIDPIDGTRAYICGIPTWGTLIALNDGIYPIIGMMDQPYLKERYLGTTTGSYLNGVKINCRPCYKLTDATVSTTDPTQFFATDDDLRAYNRVASKARLVRNGLDCYGYAMIAAGFVDVVIESGLEAYDIQALIPIIEGAGGVVTSWTGKSAAQGGQVVACASAELHKEVLTLLNG
ncbi:MAG: histidinol-phosphatase [Emcibacter sp.]|nr:histidinol-phosphatase [Emcibacter sp.]